MNVPIYMKAEEVVWGATVKCGNPVQNSCLQGLLSSKKNIELESGLCAGEHNISKIFNFRRHDNDVAIKIH